MYQGISNNEVLQLECGLYCKKRPFKSLWVATLNESMETVRAVLGEGHSFS